MLCVHVCKNACMYVCKYVEAMHLYQTFVFSYVRICLHTRVCMCAHTYIYIYIYIYIHGCALCVLAPPPPPIPPPPPMVSPPKPPQIQGPEASRPKGLPLEARTVGGGDAAGSRAQNRGGGGRGCRRSRGYPVPQVLKYKST